MKKGQYKRLTRRAIIVHVVFMPIGGAVVRADVLHKVDAPYMDS